MEIDRSERKRWALVLSVGAARGIAHAGVLKVLEEEDLRDDLIVGTSVGALAGVFMAAGVSAARTIRLAETLRWSSIARPVINRMGLLSNDKLGELVERALPVDRKSTRLNSSHVAISYAVFCLKKKKTKPG